MSVSHSNKETKSTVQYPSGFYFKQPQLYLNVIPILLIAPRIATDARQKKKHYRSVTKCSALCKSHMWYAVLLKRPTEMTTGN